MIQTQQVERYVELYNEVKQAAGWSADKRTSMIIASQFIGIEDRFDIKELKQLAEKIKRRSGTFSYLRSHLRFSVAGLLLSSTLDQETALEETSKNYEALISGGFSRSAFTHIAACALTLSQDGQRMTSVNRAKEIHEGMRQRHLILTGQADYPLAVLLALEEGETEALLEEVEFYYNAFEGFMQKGNERQALSHILTYSRTDRRQELADRTIQWLDALRYRNIRIKKIHYPLLGILALLGTPKDLLEEVTVAHEALERERAFRWSGGLSLLAAIRLAVQNRTKTDSFFGLSIAATLEAVLQAQQAAAIAAVTTVASGSASSSS